MRGMETGKTRIRHEVFTEIARMAYEGGDYAQRLEELPYKICPGDPDEIGPFRNNLLIERAVVGERLRLAMGLPMRKRGDRHCREILRAAAYKRHQIRVQPLPG